jgi:hypothetical protein
MGTLDSQTFPEFNRVSKGNKSFWYDRTLYMTGGVTPFVGSWAKKVRLSYLLEIHLQTSIQPLKDYLIHLFDLFVLYGE